MKTNQAPHNLAVLSATTDSSVGIASLSFSLTEENQGWCQLLPAGHFSAVDGRPSDVPGGKWFINAEIAQRLINTAQNSANDLVIDYEHQTLNKDQNGQPAPAAGWFKADMEWREGSGLWIKPQWTSRAQEHIEADEYRFLSAVFPYNKRTGEPLYIHSAALTNRAGIDGMQQLEALCAHVLSDKPQETPAMNGTLRKLLAKLGIKLGENDQLSDDQATAALSALTDLETKAGKTTELETQIAALSSQDVDLTKWVPVETYNGLAGQMAALSAESDKNTAKNLIDTAQAEGRILASEVNYYTSLGKQSGVAALTAALENRAPIAALTAQQTDGKDKLDETDKTGVAALSSQELAVCASMNISPEEYLKNKGDQ